MPLSDLHITLPGYLGLIQWTHSSRTKNNLIAPKKVLADIGQSETQWLSSVQAHSAKYRAYGLPEVIDRYTKKLKQHWIQIPTLRLLAQAPE